jgi:acylphosphatase
MNAETRCIRAIIRGRVQGVGYRAWTAQEARQRALSGWVRNRPDGSVEAVFNGSAEAVDAMIAACWRGPPGAAVSAVEVSAAEAVDRSRQGSFVILPTA